jgi:hypothetical protein
MRYVLTLAAYLPVQVLAYVLTPLLPLFAEPRKGLSLNGNVWAVGPRLPLWLAWFDTPDNDLRGDGRWQLHHDGSYLDQVQWLYRNSLYGFKWTVLARDIELVRWVQGDPQIGYKRPQFGTLRIKQPNGAWQFKIVKPLFGRIFEGNFGWLLDDTSKQRALFMCSPRLK